MQIITKKLVKFCLSFALVLPLVLLFTNAIKAQSKTVLSIGKSNKSDLKLKETHDYFVSLKAGQFASVKIKQISIGVYFVVFDPTGKLVQIADYNAINFAERITIEATTSGEYKVQVGWDYGEPSSGTYEIVLDKLEISAKNPNAKADQLLNSWYDSNSPGAAVVVLKNNKIIFNSVKGLASVEHNIPITNSTRFEMASVSKQFTGFAMAMLIDKGLISLDDDIRKYLPEVPDFGRKITVRHLIYHTSGIRDWTYCFQLAGYKIEDVSTIEMILNFVANQKQLNFNPNDDFSYSNTGYNLLAVILERVTKQSFSSWTKENIFKPLGMNSTFFKEDYRDAIKNEAFSYGSDSPPFKLKKGNMAAFGSTSLYSTIDDLIKWVNNFDSHSIGNENVFKIIKTQGVLNNDEKLSYAFGNDKTTYKKLNLIQHLGLTLGYRTSVRRFPDQKISVIYLANDGNDATYGRAEKIAELYLQGLESEPPPTMPEFPNIEESAEKSAENPELVNYVGTFYSEELGATYNLKILNHKLTALHSRINPIVLTYSKLDNFSANTNFMQKIEFVRNAKNEVIGFKVSNGSDRNILFVKARF
jgi:CubicO group peptidase (beta-lactamase class C family)